jgi:hypothetical protein
MNTEARMLMSVSPSSARAALPTAIPITRLGRFAADALRAESRWVVQAVFRRSFYCRSQDGSFVCVGPMSLGSGPLNVLCPVPERTDWGAAGFAPGSAATCDGTWFRVAEHFVFSLVDATVWRPATPATRWQPATMRANLVALSREARARSARGGLQALVPLFAGNATNLVAGMPGADALNRMALGGAESLAIWLEASLGSPEERVPMPSGAIAVLVGLGPGLTPSGDDFLGGVLVALRQLGASGLAARLATAVLAHAEWGTNEISRAHLAAAASGEGAAALHGLLTSLCTPGAPGMRDWVSAIEAIGHSSGWDAVAGISLAAAGFARIGLACGKAAATA